MRRRPRRDSDGWLLVMGPEREALVGVGPGGFFAERLQAVGTVPAACTVVVEHLLQVGLSLPSVYLERGGRLRCVAVRGYWQVFDGMPVDAGVIGATFTSGSPTEVRSVSSSAQYLRWRRQSSTRSASRSCSASGSSVC